MTFPQSDILHEEGDYFILRVSDGVEVYRNTGTHSVRCAGLYFKDHAQNMERALAEIGRRKAIDVSIGHVVRSTQSKVRA